MITRINRNIHEVKPDRKQIELLLISDVHFDSPHCNRDLLRSHLIEAVRRNAYVLINGDFFDLMNGRGDPRRSKDEIRQEYNRVNYIDSVIQDAVEWLRPYADRILLIGYGNHETSVIKNIETDVLARFVTLMQYVHKSPVQLGGYGGVVAFNVGVGNHCATTSLKYFHGSGGGGIVTKGVIQNQRLLANTEGYDVLWQGHVHELYHHTDMVERYWHSVKKVCHRQVDQIRTSTYKEEYEDGFMGFHIERGANVKPLGGYWMRIEYIRSQDKGKDFDYNKVTFEQCKGIYTQSGTNSKQQ